MPSRRSICLRVTLAALLGTSAFAQDSPTLSNIIRGMTDLADTLTKTRDQDEENGSQFALMSNMLKSAADRMRDAYSGALDKSITTLNLKERDVIAKLLTVSREVGAMNLRDVQTARMNDLIYRLHDSMHALFDILPVTERPPAYFGAQTSYFLKYTPYSTYDLLILGYHLVDPRLNNRIPDIALLSNKSRAFPESLTADLSRLSVRFPPYQSRQFHLSSSPCAGPPLTLALTIHYIGGLWSRLVESGSDSGIHRQYSQANIELFSDGPD